MAAYSLSTITDIVCEEVSYLLGEEGDSVNNVENEDKNEDKNKQRNKNENEKKNKNRNANESKNDDRTNNEGGTTRRKIMKYSDIIRKLIIFSCFSATFLLSASRSASNYVNYSGKKLTLFSHFVCFVLFLFFCFFVCFFVFLFVCLFVCFAFNIVSWLHSSLICQLIAYPLFVNITLSLTHLLSHSLSSCLSMSLSISVTRTFLSYDHASLYHTSSVFLHHHLFLILSTFSFHVHFIFFSSPLISTLILQIHILHSR